MVYKIQEGESNADLKFWGKSFKLVRFPWIAAEVCEGKTLEGFGCRELQVVVDHADV